MAFFGTTIEVIKTCDKHPNADKLSVCTLEGIAFTFVTGIDLFKVGDKIIYFPIDSIIPNNIAERIGVLGKLAGKEKNRLKTCKIRGVLSQGLVGPIDLIDDPDFYAEWKLNQKLSAPTPELITAFLGVVKYEPPVIPDKAGNLKPLPNGLSIYDIEGCERFGIPLGRLMDQKVWILEKLEGSNGSVSYSPDSKVVYVNQRRHTIEEIEGHQHTWWSIAREQKFVDFVTKVGEATGKPTSIYFEVLGPGWQGNIYKLAKCAGYIFDLKVGDSFISKGEMFRMLDEFFGAGNYLHAPILSQGVTLRDWLAGRTIVQASNGESKLFKTIREGIVITPEVEQEDETLGGRLILKQRDPVYLLAESDN